MILWQSEQEWDIFSYDSKVVEMSVNNNKSFQYYPHSDDHIRLILCTDSAGFKPVIVSLIHLPVVFVTDS